MIEHETSIINRLAHDRAENVAASRFFGNEAVRLEALIEAGCAKTREACTGRHVLAIQDTTEINYAYSASRPKRARPERRARAKEEAAYHCAHGGVARAE